MRKLLFVLGFFVSGSFAFAGTEKYKVDDAAVDQLFAQSQDISSDMIPGPTTVMDMNQSAGQKLAGGQTIGGFLLRTFFCGWIGLHRHYMGSDDMWWRYLITAVFCVNLPAAVDFFWVLFVGDDALSKYKGSDKWFVWM